MERPSGLWVFRPMERHSDYDAMYRMHFVVPRIRKDDDDAAGSEPSQLPPTIDESDFAVWTVMSEYGETGAMHPVESMLFSLFNASLNDSGVVHTVSVFAAMLGVPKNSIAKPFGAVIPRIGALSSEPRRVVNFNHWTKAARRIPLQKGSQFETELVRLAWNNEWVPADPGPLCTVDPASVERSVKESIELFRLAIAAGNYQLIEHVLAIEVEEGNDDADGRFRRIAFDLVNEILSAGDVYCLQVLRRIQRMEPPTGSFGRSIASSLLRPPLGGVSRSSHCVLSLKAAQGIVRARTPTLMFELLSDVIARPNLQLGYVLRAAVETKKKELVEVVLSETQRYGYSIPDAAFSGALVRAIEVGSVSIRRWLVDNRERREAIRRALQSYLGSISTVIVDLGSETSSTTVGEILCDVREILGEGETWAYVIDAILTRCISNSPASKCSLTRFQHVAEWCEKVCPELPVLGKWPLLALAMMLDNRLDSAMCFMCERYKVDPLTVLDEPICAGMPLFHLCVFYGMYHSTLFFLTNTKDLDRLLKSRAEGSDALRDRRKFAIRGMNPEEIGQHVTQHPLECSPCELATAKLIHSYVALMPNS